MGFQDLSDFFTPGIELPIRGKNYLIPAPSAEEGLRLHMLMHNPALSLTDDGEVKEIMRLLGATWEPNLTTVDVTDPDTGAPILDGDGEIVTTEMDYGHYTGGVYQEMADDGVSWREIMHAGRTALVDVGMGRTMAEITWTMNAPSGNPLPPEPGANREQRRAAEKAAKKAPTKKAATGRTPASRKRTAKTTPAAGRTTRKQG